MTTTQCIAEDAVFRNRHEVGHTHDVIYNGKRYHWAAQVESGRVVLIARTQDGQPNESVSIKWNEPVEIVPTVQS